MSSNISAGATLAEPAHEEMDDDEYFDPVNEDGEDASLKVTSECPDTEERNGDIFLEFLLEFGGWDDEDFDLCSRRWRRFLDDKDAVEDVTDDDGEDTSLGDGHEPPYSLYKSEANTAVSAIARRIVNESAAAVAGASCTESLYKSEARAGVLAIMRRFADEPVAVEAGASEDKRDCSGDDDYDDDAPIEDTAALDTMVGLYTPTQFHDERLRKDGTPLDYYDERLSDRWLATPSCRDGYLRVEPEAEALELPGFEGKTLYKLAANRIFVPAVRPEFESWVKDITKDLPAFCAQLRPGGPPGAAPICLFPKAVDSPLEFFAMESGQRYGMYGSNIMVPDLETRCGSVFTSGLESGQRYGTYEAFRPFSPVWRDTLAQVANLAAKHGIFQVFQAQDISRVRAFLDFWGGRYAHRFRFQSAWLEKYGGGHKGKNARALMRTIYDPITGEKSWMPSWFIAILNTLATAVNKDAPLA